MRPAGDACCIQGAVLAGSIHHKVGAAVKGWKRLLPQRIRSCSHSSFAAKCPTRFTAHGICNRYAAALLPSKPCRAPYRDMVINHAKVLQL